MHRLGARPRGSSITCMLCFLIDLCVWMFCLYLYHVHTWCPWKSAHGVLPGTGVPTGLWATIWVLGVEPRSSVRATSTLSYWAILLTPSIILKLPRLRCRIIFHIKRQTLINIFSWFICNPPSKTFKELWTTITFNVHIKTIWLTKQMMLAFKMAKSEYRQ